MKNKVFAVLFTLACGSPVNDLVDENGEPIGVSTQEWSVKASSTGTRTWGVNGTGTEKLSCTNAVGQNCRFVHGTYFGDAAGTRVFNVYVATTPLQTCSQGFCGSEYTAVKNAVDVWVGGMGSSLTGATLPHYFARVTDPSTANIFVYRTDRTGDYSNKHSRYIDVAFASCTSPVSINVNPTFYDCGNATVYFDMDDLTQYTLQQGYSSSKQTQARNETIVHGLHKAFGWGQQASITTTASYGLFSTTSKTFSTNEQNCRAKSITGVFGVNDGLFTVDFANTCAN